MPTLHERPWSHSLDADGAELRLTVLCGTVALYALTVALTAEETARWQREGETFVDALAARIQRDPGAFTHRRVPSPPSSDSR